MFTRKSGSKSNSRAEILLVGQSLSFKLNENETAELLEKLEEVTYDFKKLESIKLFYPDGKLKSVVNPLNIARIWFS